MSRPAPVAVHALGRFVQVHYRRYVPEIDAAKVALAISMALRTRRRATAKDQRGQDVGAEHNGTVCCREVLGSQAVDFGVPPGLFGQRPIRRIGQGFADGRVPFRARFAAAIRDGCGCGAN